MASILMSLMWCIVIITVAKIYAAVTRTYARYMIFHNQLSRHNLAYSNTLFHNCEAP